MRRKTVVCMFFYHSNLVCHTVELSVKKGYDIPEISGVLKKTSKLVTYFIRSTISESIQEYLEWSWITITYHIHIHTCFFSSHGLLDLKKDEGRRSLFQFITTDKTKVSRGGRKVSVLRKIKSQNLRKLNLLTH